MRSYDSQHAPDTPSHSQPLLSSDAVRPSNSSTLVVPHKRDYTPQDRSKQRSTRQSPLLVRTINQNREAYRLIWTEADQGQEIEALFRRKEAVPPDLATCPLDGSNEGKKCEDEANNKDAREGMSFILDFVDFVKDCKDCLEDELVQKKMAGYLRAPVQMESEALLLAAIQNAKLETEEERRKARALAAELAELQRRYTETHTQVAGMAAEIQKLERELRTAQERVQKQAMIIATQARQLAEQKRADSSETTKLVRLNEQLKNENDHLFRLTQEQKKLEEEYVATNKQLEKQLRSLSERTVEDVSSQTLPTTSHTHSNLPEPQINGIVRVVQHSQVASRL